MSARSKEENYQSRFSSTASEIVILSWQGLFNSSGLRPRLRRGLDHV